MSKLARMLGGSCSDIVSVSDDSAKEMRRDPCQDWCDEHGEDGLARKEMMRVQIKDDDRRKLTPIEYLNTTGQVPKTEDVLTMRLEDLIADHARQLLAAGCSKRKLLQLYGVGQVGGPHYKLLDRLLNKFIAGEEEQQPNPEPQSVVACGFAWITPRRRAGRPARITVSLQSGLRINRPAVELAPEEYWKDCKTRVGIDASRKIIAVQPVESGAFCFRLRKQALLSSATFIGESLRQEGIEVPAVFNAGWNDELKAWVGTLEEGDRKWQ